MRLSDLDEQDRLRLGVAAAKAIRANLPVDGFGQPQRLNDWAAIWGSAARSAVLAELHLIGLKASESGEER